MSCHLGCLGKYVTGFRRPVNERLLLFEPESRAIISLSSNTPSSSNDGGRERGGGAGGWLWPREPFEDGWGEIIKNSSSSSSNNDGKKWTQQYGRVSPVDEVTHRSEVRTMRWGVLMQVRVLGFPFGKEWAFNMQLRICLSVWPSLMSCCFCSLSGGWGIIRHARRVPGRKTTGYLMFSIIRENGRASPVAADLISPGPSLRS